MAKHIINVTINLGGLRSELERSLQKTIYLVSAGLQTKDKINPEILQLPTNSITMTFDGGLRWNSEQVQEYYSEWILSNGFRDIIERLGAFLDSAHRVLSFWEIAGKQKDGVEITGTDWNEIIISGAKKFHRFGLPDKLSHLAKKHHISVDDKLKEQILSINAARNCLVHRDGVVSEADITNNGLQVKWTSLLMILQFEGGEKELVLGEVVEKDSIVAIRNQEKTKLFVLGERIVFTAQEFANIAWCLFLFGNDLVQRISSFGLENGFIIEPKPNRT